ncbi:aspartic peptidase domain-containing protein [Aspergillus venezuelensis]
MWLHYISLVAALLLSAADAQRPYILNWSTEAYGPDGPWQAVTINVGSDRQPIALYPGASYASTIFADSICANSTLSPTCYAARAGTYNESDSATSISTGSPTSNASTPWNAFYWNVQGKARQESIGDEVTLGVGESETIIPNVSITAIRDTYQTYPNGRSYPVSVGNLALGAPQLRDASSGLSLNMIASWLYTSGQIPSYSYSMHIGSVNPPIPGSLVVGGYNRTRLIGEGSTQSIVDSAGILQIVLRDIGLGVAEGASPFPAFTDTHRGGLFLDTEHGGNMNMGTVLPRTATIDPTKPYMYLPAATCDAITALFPASFDTGLGLYIWDTNSADYTTLTRSPAYLSFTFSRDGSTASAANMTIRIPLQLLALTLQEPLAEGQNRSYFPCFHSTDTLVLGRAFLQAAFVAVNWFEGANSASWFLSQAPGPGIGWNGSADGDFIVPVEVTDRTLRGAEEESWLNSWVQHWTPLEATGNESTGAPSSYNDSGLSASAKAGIGVGVSIAGLIIIAAAIWALMHRRRKKQTQATILNSTTSTEVGGHGLTELAEGDKDKPFPPMELEGKCGSAQPQEMMGTNAGRARHHELES